MSALNYMTQKKRSPIIAILLGGGILAGAFFGLSQLRVDDGLYPADNSQSDNDLDVPAAGNIVGAEDYFDREEAEKESLKILPYSLQDLQPPAQLDTNSKGELILNSKIRRLFDFYLSAKGEEDFSITLARVDAILSELPEPAQSDAKNIFENYIAYLKDVDNQTAAYGTAQTPGEWDMQQIIALKTDLINRRKLFFSDEVAKLFFEKDDVFQEFAIQRLTVMNDPVLSSAQKEEALKKLEADMPESYRRAERNSLKIQNYRKTVSRLKSKGGEGANIDQLRRENFGAEAAERLAQLDQKRAEWEQRVTAYREELAAQATYYGDTNNDAYLNAIEELRAKHFSETEARRISALDKIENIVP